MAIRARRELEAEMEALRADGDAKLAEEKAKNAELRAKAEEARASSSGSSRRSRAAVEARSRRGCRVEVAVAARRRVSLPPRPRGVTAAALETEKEKRVKHIGEMAAKRMGSRKLASGWTAWHGGWAEKRRQRQMLATAGAQLLRPKLAASLAHWRRDWSRGAADEGDVREGAARPRAQGARRARGCSPRDHDQLEAASTDAAEARCVVARRARSSANELEAERERTGWRRSLRWR